MKHECDLIALIFLTQIKRANFFRQVQSRSMLCLARSCSGTLCISTMITRYAFRTGISFSAGGAPTYPKMSLKVSTVFMNSVCLYV